MNVRDLKSLLRVDWCNESLQNAATISANDYNSGYWHIEKLEAELDITTFSSDHRLFRLVSTPRKLKKTQALFQPAWMLYCQQWSGKSPWIV